MKSLKFVFIVFLLSVNLCGQSNELNNQTTVSDLLKRFTVDAQTTLEINQSYNEVYQIVDKEFNRVYQKIINSFTKDQITEKKALVKASRSWLKFRDENCALVYEMHKDGTIRNVMYLDKMIYMTLARTNELKRHYRHIFSTEVTAGDLLGKWVDTQDQKTYLKFYLSENGKYKFILHLRTGLKKSGEYKVVDGNLIAKEMENEVINEYIFSENARLYSQLEDALFLHYLQDGGGFSKSFIKHR